MTEADLAQGLSLLARLIDGLRKEADNLKVIATLQEALGDTPRAMGCAAEVAVREAAITIYEQLAADYREMLAEMRDEGFIN